MIPAQELVLEAGLGQRADESWAASTVCHFGGRQGAGKNETVIARELAGLRLFGEQLILHTAHEFKTANESFLRLVKVFENFDDLRQLVARVRYANGEQGIEFLSGQRIKFLARTGGAGRGFAGVDLLVLDEAQHLQPEQLAALAPTMMANPNGQAWAMGSGGMSTSEIAWRWRRQGLEGRGDRFAYVEFTAEDPQLVNGKVVTSKPDAMDHDAWGRAMPGYGRYIDDNRVLQQYDLLGPDKFTRECLCVWDPEPSAEGGAFSIDVWGSLAGPSPKRGSDVVFALDVAPDHSTATIAAGWTPPGGVKWLQLADHRPGVDWVVERASELRDTWGGRLLVEETGTAAFLLPFLPWAEPVSRRFYTDACSTLNADVSSARLRHGNQPALNAAVTVARWKPSGEPGQQVLSRRDPRVSPLVAAALALHGLVTARPGGWMVGV